MILSAFIPFILVEKMFLICVSSLLLGCSVFHNLPLHLPSINFCGAIMQRVTRLLFLSALLLLTAAASHAGQLKAYVAPFAVTGAANGAELKSTLQNLLLSRLGSDSVIAVESPEGADISIKGSYIAFGKVFSLDAVAKNSSGQVLVRAFEQGESQDEMLPAVGKLAKRLLAGIETKSGKIESVPAPVAAPARSQIVSASPAVVKAPPQSDIVRVATVAELAASGWISQKLEGELIGIALGRTLASGEREVFIGGIHSVQYFLQGKELKLQAGITLPVYQQLISLDTADLDQDGVPELYLTVMAGEELVSEVWAPEGKALQKIADKLPYYFRSLSVQGQELKIFAQQTSRDSDFFGDLYEVKKKGSLFGISEPIKLPRYANIFNTAIFRSKEGKRLFAVLKQDGYLLVFDETGMNLWESSDKYGGSESFFTRDDFSNMNVTGAARRKIFHEQRITVTKSGEVIVPKNDGFFVIGNNRSYSKNSVFAFAWNGVSLDELWHTKQSQNYLADYRYDEGTKELLMLEVVKKAGIIEKGASALFIKKVE